MYLSRPLRMASWKERCISSRRTCRNGFLGSPKRGAPNCRIPYRYSNKRSLRVGNLLRDLSYRSWLGEDPWATVAIVDVASPAWPASEGWSKTATKTLWGSEIWRVDPDIWRVDRAGGPLVESFWLPRLKPGLALE